MPESTHLLDDTQIDEVSRAMKAMSHPLRLKVLCVINEHEVSVQEICDLVGTTTQSNISQHLALMRAKGVLRTRRDANRIYYRLADVRMLEALSHMRTLFSGF